MLSLMLGVRATISRFGAIAAFALAATTSAVATARSNDESALGCENKLGARWRRFALAPPPAPERKRPAPLVAPAPDRSSFSEGKEAKEPSKDDLRRRQHHRALLLREIDQLIDLLDVTPSWTPDHPRILRRLADRYSELEHDLGRDRDEIAARARLLEPTDSAAALRLGNQAKALAKLEGAARGWAIVLYREVVELHPDDCRYPLRKKGEQGCLDQVLFVLGQTLERAGEPALAQAPYRRLVADFAASPYAPRSFLALAEQSFSDARAGAVPWPRTIELYQSAVAGLAKDEVGAYARYKLAHAEWSAGDGEHALGDMFDAIRLAQTLHSSERAAAMLERARHDLVQLYAEAGDPAKALASFEPVSGGDGHERGAALEMQDELGRRLYDIGRFDEAIVAFEELKAKNGRGETCGYQSAITRAVIAAHGASKEQVSRALDAQLATYRASTATGPAASECAGNTLAVLLDVAMAWHVEAVGSNGFPGSGDALTMAAARALYVRAIANFPRGAIDAVASTEDEPGYARVLRAQGDLLYAERRWQECAVAFGAAEQANPNGGRAGDSLLFAGVCWQRALDEKLSGRESERRLTSAIFDDEVDRAMTRAFDRYACRALPAADDLDASAAHTTILRARDRVHRLER